MIFGAELEGETKGENAGRGKVEEEEDDEEDYEAPGNAATGGLDANRNMSKYVPEVEDVRRLCGRSKVREGEVREGNG